MDYYLTIIFSFLTLVVSYFGSIFSNGWQDLGINIQGMVSLVSLLIPIISLMLGYSAINGEIDPACDRGGAIRVTTARTGCIGNGVISVQP